MRLKLRKKEKLCSQTAIDALFASPEAKSALAFPLRMVWVQNNGARRSAVGVPVQFFISVPKKKLRHAVDRVKMRRRIREAYRLNRRLIPEHVECTDLAIIYVAPELVSYQRIERAIQKLLPQL